MKKTILAAAFILTASCGTDSDSPKEIIKDGKQGFLNLVEQPSQQGGWTGPCNKSEFLDLSQKIEYAFLGNQLEKRVIFFEDAECEKSAGQARFKGEFSVDEQDGGDTYNLDSKYENVEVKAENDSLQKLFEDTTFCGQSSYDQGEWVDVTEVSGQGACQFGEFPRTEYNVMKVSGNKMYLGNALVVAVSTEENRPKEVNKSVEFTKTF